MFSQVFCSEPPNLYNRHIPTIPLDEFICDVTEKCPTSCSCSYQPYMAIMHVKCSELRQIEPFPLYAPNMPKSYTRYHLQFGSTEVRRLEYRQYFTRTALLNLSHSRVDEIDFDAWNSLMQIDIVLLNGNSLTKFPRYCYFNVLCNAIFVVSVNSVLTSQYA